MKFFKKREATKEKESFEQSSSIIQSIIRWASGSTSVAEQKVLKLSTVYRSINLISDSIAKLEFIPYHVEGEFMERENTSLYNLLNVEPNSMQGAFIFKKSLVIWILMRGEVFVRIWRTRNNKVYKLKILEKSKMKVEVNNHLDEILYTYDGEHIDPYDIIHVVNYPDDSGHGRSVISYAADTLGMGIEIERHSRSVFQKLGKIFGMISPRSSDIVIKDEKKLKSKFVQENISDDSGIIVLDADLEFKPLQLTPKDAQIIESKNLNVNDICRFFGVPSILVYDASVSSNYNSSEQTILEYINNTLHPLMEKIENEFFRKLYLPSEWTEKDLLFNTDDLYRLDYKTLGEYFTKLIGVGGILPNDVRQRLKLKPVVGGNRAFVNTNLQPLDNLVYDQKFKPKNKIDNNLK